MISRTIAGGTLLQLATKFAGLFMGLIVAAAMARGLGRDDFGWATLGLTVIGLLGVACDAGMTQAASREIARRPSDSSSVAGAVLLSRLSLSGLLAALGILCAFTLGDSVPVVPLLILFASLLTGAPIGLLAVFNANLRPDLVGWTGFAQSVVWTTLVVLCAAFDLGLAAYAAAFTVASACQGLMTYGLARKFTKIDLRHAFPEMRAMLRWSWHISVGSVITGLMQRGPMFVLQAKSGASQTALFGAAWRLFDSATVISTALNATLVPLCAGREERRKRIIDTFLLASSGLAVGLLAIIGPVAEPFGLMLFGGEFAGVGSLLIVAFAVYYFYSLEAVWNGVLIADGRTSALKNYGLVALAISAVVAYPLVASSGAFGAAMAVLIAQVVRTCLISVAVRDCLRDLSMSLIARVALAGLAAALVTFCLQVVAPWMLAAAFGSFAYAALLYFVSPIRPNELISMLKKPTGDQSNSRQTVEVQS